MFVKDMFIKDKKIAATCVMSMLLMSLGLGGCQKHEEPANSISDESIEEVQPMSAEPAEADEALVIDQNTDNQNTEAVAGVDDIATVNVKEVDYNCTPALEVHASYNMADNNVVLDVSNNGLVLTATNPGENPLVYTDEQEITQWRVTQGSQEDMGQAVLRTNEGDAVQSYECNIVS